jgi:hypothetical protein
MLTIQFLQHFAEHKKVGKGLFLLESGFCFCSLAALSIGDTVNTFKEYLQDACNSFNPFMHGRILRSTQDGRAVLALYITVYNIFLVKIFRAICYTVKKG